MAYIDTQRSEEDDVEAIVHVGRALSDPARVRLLMELRAGERSVGDLVVRTKSPQPTVCHNLGLLKALGLVGARRSGKHVFHSLIGQARSPAGNALLRFETADGLHVAVARRAAPA